MGSHWMQLTRVITLGVVSFFSLIVLALGGHLISVETEHLALYYNYAALGVATGVLSFGVPAMIIIDFMRRGAFTSMILVELVYLGFLWIMWLATGALAADTLGTFGNCHSDLFFGWWQNHCSETQALTAFSFLNWIGLTGYLVALLTFSIIAQQHGTPIWKSSVKEANFTPVKVDLTGAMGSAEAKPTMGTPMQQQPVLGQSYPPQQTYSPQAQAPQQPYQPTSM